MSKIKVILWDIDGTLLNFQQAEKTAIRKCFSIFGLGTCTDEMLQKYSGINRTYWERLERGELTKPQVLEGRFQEFFKEEGLNREIIPDFNKEYQLQLGETVAFEREALETVTALKGKVKQYAVTNGTRIAQERKLSKSGLNQLLDGVFISEEVGFEKPGTGFFDVVFDKIGFYDKKEILIVGDSLTSDMRGGNNAGILCCWYNPWKLEKNADVKIDYEIRTLGQVLHLI